MSVLITIDGAPYTPFTDFGAKQQPTYTRPFRGQRGTCTFVLDIDATAEHGSGFKPAVGQFIKIYEVFGSDAQIRWTGTIDSVKVESWMAPISQLGTWYTVQGVTEEQRLDKRLFSGSFPAGTMTGAIVASVLGYVDEGITIGNIDPGTAITAPITCLNQRVSDLFTQLASYSVGPVEVPIGQAFVWFIFDSKIYFQQATTDAAPIDIDDETMKLGPQQPADTIDRSNYRNVQYVQINTSQLAPLVEQFETDGTLSDFVTSQPIQQVVSITVTPPAVTPAPLVGTFLFNPSDGDTFSWGPNEGQTYTFKNTPVGIWDVQIAPYPGACALNLVNAINGVGQWLSEAGSWRADVNGAVVTFGSAVKGSFVPTMTISCSAFSTVNQGSTLAGNFTANPANGDTVEFGGTQWYQFVTAFTGPGSGTFLDPYQVFIGTNAAQTAATLGQAINGTNGLGTQSTLVTASVSGSSVTFTVVAPGTAIVVTSTAWTGAAATSQSQQNASAGPQTFAEASAGGSPNWQFVAGKNHVYVINPAYVPLAGSTITVAYQPVGFGNCKVINQAQIDARKAIEGGSGIYENAVTRSDIVTIEGGFHEAQALLDAYDDLAITLVFWTYEQGLLPGQVLPVVSERLQINGNFLISQIKGLWEKPNDTDSHMRYEITCVWQPLQKNWLDVFTKAMQPLVGQSSVVNTAPVTTNTTPEPAPITWEATFGLADDTTGVNAATKYAPITQTGAAVRGLLTVVTNPSAPSTFDILYSTDQGATWTSIFSTLPTIPSSGGHVFQIQGFTSDSLPAGCIMRLDVTAGGNGAAGIVVWLAGGQIVGGGAGPSGGIPGSALMFMGDGVI